MKTILMFIISVLLFVSCSQERHPDVITLAEEYIQSGEYELAQDECDMLLSQQSFASFSVSELSRLSVLYMKLSEKMDEEANVASATQCYLTACELNADSVAEYFSALPIEDECHVIMLRTLIDGINTPDSVAVAYDVDSLTSEIVN